MADTARVLEELLRAHPGAGALLPRLASAAADPGSPAFRAAYAGAPRRLGAAARDRVVPPPELAELFRPGWALADLARAFLVLSAFARLEPNAQPGLVLRLLEGGEIGEQESLLRTLLLLPEPERFTETAVAACRTNARSVFEAIACENAFPARFFPELAFNQLVLKAIFVEVSVRRVEGLRARITPELSRMVSAYASERRAAGRAIPTDVDFILNGGTEP